MDLVIKFTSAVLCSVTVAIVRYGQRCIFAGEVVPIARLQEGSLAISWGSVGLVVDLVEEVVRFVLGLRRREGQDGEQ